MPVPVALLRGVRCVVAAGSIAPESAAAALALADYTIRKSLADLGRDANPVTLIADRAGVLATGVSPFTGEQGSRTDAALTLYLAAIPAVGQTRFGGVNVGPKLTIPRVRTVPIKPQVPGSRTLTPADVAAIKRVSEKYNVRIDVGGSRANGRGRNIDRFDLPVSKGPGTRSDIDFIVSPDHPQYRSIMDELREVGGGAGQPHPDNGFLSAFPSAGEELGDGWRIRFEPGADPATSLLDGSP